MRLKIRCDEKYKKFCKIFRELNKAEVSFPCVIYYAYAVRGTGPPRGTPALRQQPGARPHYCCQSAAAAVSSVSTDQHLSYHF